MSESVPRKYRCDECGTLHDFEDDAYTCCPPSVSAVFVCQDCGDWHREESEAAACCCDDDETAETRRQAVLTPTAEQLEAIGQLRLVP